MRNKIILIIIVVLLLGICMVTFYFSNVFYSKQLIDAIDSKNYERLDELCNQKFGNKDALPVFSTFFANVFEEKTYSTPLQHACSQNDIKAVKCLLENGAEPNYIPKRGMDSTVPLEYAISHANFEMIELLFEHGAVGSVNEGIDLQCLVKYEGQNVTAEKFAQICNLLTSHGIDLTQKDSKGRTIFLSNALYNNVDIASYLIETGSFLINDTDLEQKTALHICCDSGFSKPTEEYVMLLRNAGIDFALRDIHGKTAYDYAVENGYLDIADLLK